MDAFVTESLPVELEKVNRVLPESVPLALNCTCVSDPPGIPTQVPLTDTQPPFRTRPLPKVDDAVVEVIFRVVAVMPPPKVEVPVPVTVRDVAETLVPEIVPPVMVESLRAILSSSSMRRAPPTAL